MMFSDRKPLPPESFFYAPLDRFESTLLKEDERTCPHTCFRHI